MSLRLGAGKEQWPIGLRGPARICVFSEGEKDLPNLHPPPGTR